MRARWASTLVVGLPLVALGSLGCDSSDSANGTGTGSGAAGATGGSGGSGGVGGSGGTGCSGGPGGGGAGGTDPCADHCSNGVQDCGETGTDCGGGGCPTCPDPYVVLGQCYQTPFVKVYSPQRIMVVWAAVTAGPIEIYASCFDGSTWSTGAPVYATTLPSEYPRLAVDSTGVFHLANVNGLGTNSHIRHGTYGAVGCAGEWVDGGHLDTESYTCWDPGGGGCYRSGWPNLDVDDSDHPWVVWTEDDFTMIHFSRHTGSAWTDPVDLADTHGTDYSAVGDIALAGHTGYVVWLEGHSGWGTTRRLMFREGDGTSWQDRIDLEGSNIKNPRLDVSAAGDVYIIAVSGNYGPVLFRARLGGDWQPEWQELASGQPFNPWQDIKIDENGTLHAVWLQDDGGDVEVYYATGDGATGIFNAARKASNAANAVFDPVLDVDAEGYAHIVWVEDTPPADDEGSVVYAKVRYEDL